MIARPSARLARSRPVRLLLLAGFAVAGLALAPRARADDSPPARPASPAPPAEEVAPEVAALRAAIRTNDLAKIATAHEAVLEAVKKAPQRYDLQLAAALGYVARADLLRIERHTGHVDSDTNSSYRDQQAEWGEAGAGYAEAALGLAKTKHERSEAHRVKGEATVHRISGPINGFRFGPVAKGEVEQALADEPENPEALRASGLMFLHNPPINGGDLDKAVETFTKVARLADSDVPHALLAQTWLKKGRPERAILEAKLALKQNPDNRLAKNVKARAEAGDE